MASSRFIRIIYHIRVAIPNPNARLRHVGVNSITRAEVAEEGTSLTATNDLANDRLSLCLKGQRPRKFASVGLVIICSRNPKTIAVRIRIDFDHDLLDSSARRLAATNRLHGNKTSRLQLCERAREVWLGSPRHLHQFGN
jgi:hypothetical protein